VSDAPLPHRSREQAQSGNNYAGGAERPQPGLVANFRHELRSPLNAVIGYSEMLLEDVADAEELERLYPGLENIHVTANQLLSLVNEALHPDRTSIGAEELRAALRAPTEALIADCEALLAGGEVLGQAALIPDLKKICSASESFLSLIEDADEFWRIAAGGGELRLHQEASDASVLVVVQDDASLPEDDGMRTDGDLLLIVDDDEVNRDVLARHLGRQGYAAAVAENGIEALEMVRARKFDLMLLDVMMPKMDGYETLRLMKADSHLRDIPVIMISALDDIKSVVRCIEMGAEDYLPKPFDPVLLRARIGACLEKKRLRDLEIEYLRNVDHVTAAAAAVEAGEFDPATIEQVASRSDELGQLARVFQRMAREVYAREQRLKQEVHRLRIEIDERRTARQVAEITETDYFQELQRKVDTLRLRSDDAKP
jgi:DNA-binding response OmpR family regulator